MCIYIFSFSLADSVLLEAELQFYHPHSFNFTTCQLYCLLLEVFFFPYKCPLACALKELLEH